MRIRVSPGRFLLAAAIAAMSAGAADAQQKPVTLRGITPWVADYDLSKAFFQFQELVHQRFKGRITVSYLGGPEVVPPNEQFAALRNGVVDVLLGAAAYYRGEVPAAAAVQFTKRLPSELRKSGYFDLMRQIHAEQGNVVYLANTAGGNKFRLYMRKKIDKPDLTGLKIRVSPVYTPLVRALNGTPVSMAPGEVYTALERGVVDGFGWTYTGIDVFGWHEVSKYIVDHPFYSLDGAILINMDVWKSLPEDVRQVLSEIGVELERRVEAYMQDRLSKEDSKLRRLGLEFIRFSPADAERFIAAAYDEGWRDFLQKNAEYFAKHPGLADRLRALGE